MKIINSIDEALDFFLGNSSGTVLCRRNDGTEFEAASFPEAEEFFSKKV